MIIKLVGHLQDFSGKPCSNSNDGMYLKHERIETVYSGVERYSFAFRSFTNADNTAGASRPLLSFTIKGENFEIGTDQYERVYIMNDEGKTIDKY